MMGRRNIGKEMNDKINFTLVPVSIAECIGYSITEEKESGKRGEEKKNLKW